MTSRMEKFLNSRYGLTLAADLARSMPPRLGYALARLAAGWLASRRDSDLVKAVRTNQWVAAGEPADPARLDQAARAVFRNSARSIYDLYHYMQNPEAAGRRFVFEPSMEMLKVRPEFDERGLVVAGIHMSSFDLALQWICTHWINPLALTIPNPQGGRQLEFELRRKTGLNMVPASMSGLRQAIRHLKNGGVVATGLDRPQNGVHPRPLFFGRPASLPVHYISLALKAGAPLVVVSCRLQADGKFHVFASAPIEMVAYPDRTEELLCNAASVLAVAENMIRESPEQWIMAQAVWPEAVALAPG